jgi:alpha-beta hydrolase superfamily lysophospholipase
MYSEHKTLKMRDGVELAVKIKESGSAVWIVGTHGIGEHSGRHKYLIDLFGQDFNIFQYDLRGHGESGGRRSYVLQFEEYMEDLQEILRFLSSKYRMKRFALFGHSMGALITSSFMQSYVEDQIYPERVVLNAPPCGMAGGIGEVLKLLPGSFIPSACKLPITIPLGGLVDLNFLSHDARVKDEYIKDPLNILKLESKLLLELVKMSQITFSRPLRSRAENFVSIGEADRVVSFKSVKEYFSSVDKSFKLTIIDGAYHEIHNEIEKYRKPYFDYLKKVFNDMLFHSID